MASHTVFVGPVRALEAFDRVTYIVVVTSLGSTKHQHPRGRIFLPLCAYDSCLYVLLRFDDPSPTQRVQGVSMNDAARAGLFRRWCRNTLFTVIPVGERSVVQSLLWPLDCRYGSYNGNRQGMEEDVKSEEEARLCIDPPLEEKNLEERLKRLTGGSANRGSGRRQCCCPICTYHVGVPVTILGEGARPPSRVA